MRKEITDVQLIDDIDGSPATATIEFTFDGKNYIIDLSEQHADEFNKALAPYIEHARRARHQEEGFAQVAQLQRGRSCQASEERRDPRLGAGERCDRLQERPAGSGHHRRLRSCTRCAHYREH